MVARSGEAGCIQADGWADPNSRSALNALFEAPMPLYLACFRLKDKRESAESLSEVLRQEVAA